MCVLSMKVPIQKKSGNLFDDPRNNNNNNNNNKKKKKKKKKKKNQSYQSENWHDSTR